MPSKKKYLVTGGAGFIGSHLATHLVGRGNDVSVLDDLSSGSLTNLDAVKDSVLIQVGSVSNLCLVEKLASKVDVIFHLATQCLVMGIDRPSYLHEVNDLGTFNVCLAAKHHNCKVVYTSTSEVYGDQEIFPIREDAPLRPSSLYALTKALGERYVKFFHDWHNVAAVIIRPFNTFGPLQREDLDMERLLQGFNAYAGVITSFLKRIQDGKPPIIFGSGLQNRDFTYVTDIVDGLTLLSELEDCETVNLGSGQTTSILELANLLVDLYGAGLDLKSFVFKPSRPNDIRSLLADISLARSYGYEPKVSLREGLERYAGWYRNQRL